MREHRDTETVCNPLRLDDRRAKVPCQVLCRPVRNTSLLSREKLLPRAQTVKVRARETCQKLSICAISDRENYVSRASLAHREEAPLLKRELGSETLMDDANL